MLLSICIPTYNRAEYLSKTLESLVSQKCWPSPEVEIVISDNASTDNTAQVIAEYQARYPENIRGTSLLTGIDPHENFDLVMSRGKGKYIKLNNDTLMWNPGMLEEFIHVLRETSPDIFLTPSTPMCRAADKRSYRINGIDEAVSNCSYFMTSIGHLCIRREAFAALDDRNRKIASRLTQLDITLRLLSSGCHAVMDGRNFFTVQKVHKVVDYQIAEVFGNNYFEILREYLGSELTPAVFEQEKKRIFQEFLIPSYFDFFNEKSGLKQKSFWKYTGIYHKNFYFYISFIKVVFLKIVCRIFPRNFLRKVKNIVTVRGEK